MTTSWAASLRSRAYRAPGSSRSFARSLGATTCFACTGKLAESHAWGACLAARLSPSDLPSSRLGVRSCHSGMGGGLSLRSAAATRAAAYWAPSADAMPVIGERRGC